MRLRRQKGAVALEALLSLVLLFVIFYAMWSTAQVIYQQSRLNTSVQLAAQAGLLEYNRTVSRGGSGAVFGGGADPEAQASSIATAVFEENFCINETMIGGIQGDTAKDKCDLTDSDGDPSDFQIVFECAQTPGSQSWESNCQTGGRENTRALRAVAGAKSEQNWILADIASFGFSLSQKTLYLSAESTSYAYSAEDQ